MGKINGRNFDQDGSTDSQLQHRKTLRDEIGKEIPTAVRNSEDPKVLVSAIGKFADQLKQALGTGRMENSVTIVRTNIAKMKPPRQD